VGEGSAGDGEDDEEPGEAGEPPDEAEALTPDEEFEEPAALEAVESEDDDVDEDVRPEDQY
jgi:hypothetical protein